MLTHKVPQEMYPLGIAYQSKSSICIADIEVLTLHPKGCVLQVGNFSRCLWLLYPLPTRFLVSSKISGIQSVCRYIVNLQRPTPKLSICSEICKTATCYDKCSPQQTQSNMNILYVTWKETTGRYDIQEMKMPESALLGKKPLPAAPKPIM